MKQVLPVLFYLFVCSLFIRLAYFIISLIKLKQKINKFGYKYCSLPNLIALRRKNYYSELFSYLIAVICSAVIFFLTKEKFVFLFIILCIVNFLGSSLVRKTSKYNGVYEKGIIIGIFIKWNKIVSWEKVDDSNLIIHTKNGKKINLNVVENLESIIKLIEEKLDRSL